MEADYLTRVIQKAEEAAMLCSPIDSYTRRLIVVELLKARLDEYQHGDGPMDPRARGLENEITHRLAERIRG